MAVKRLRKAADVQKAEPTVLVRSRPAVTPEKVVELIKNGNFDQHLRPIVRACFARRELLFGDAHVIEDPPTSESKSPLPPARKKVRVSTDARPALTETEEMYNWFLLGNGELIAANSIEPPKTLRGRPIEYAGRQYDREQFLGKTFWLPAIGAHCGIIGLGSTMFKLLILNEPTTRNEKENWNNREPYFYPVPRVLRELVSDENDD
jgi:hypothetical protein